MGRKGLLEKFRERRNTELLALGNEQLVDELWQQIGFHKITEEVEPSDPEEFEFIRAEILRRMKERS